VLHHTDVAAVDRKHSARSCPSLRRRSNIAAMRKTSTSCVRKKTKPPNRAPVDPNLPRRPTSAIRSSGRCDRSRIDLGSRGLISAGALAQLIREARSGQSGRSRPGSTRVR
jgi:hypothetical protein